MDIQRFEVCRGGGSAFFHVRVTEDDGCLPCSLRVRVRANGVALPGMAVPDRHSADPYGGYAWWTVVCPILDARHMIVEISSLGETATFSVRPSWLKWASRFNYRRAPERCVAMRAVSSTVPPKGFGVRVLRRLEADDGAVWRIAVSWHEGVDAAPEPVVFNTTGERVDARVWRFESQGGGSNGRGGVLARQIFSLKMPASLDSFVLRIRDKTGALADGVATVDPPVAEALKGDSWVYMKDARADDQAYRAWLLRHRADAATLAAQRAEKVPDAPTFSVIVPCFRSNEGFLRAAVRSVTAQSYVSWELVLVDSSPSDGVVARIAAEANDRRVRRLELQGNGGIVANTNAGIAAAQGEYLAFLDHDDLLEPDALYCYARALLDGARADVLFCDEDLFEREGEYSQPVFKTQLNVDLLYSHNCVTHFLAVSRELVRKIGVSPEDVSGAQDYDLVLRALAAGAAFRHVPRVLYHWRMHAGSTSGDNEGGKSYAEEAGRLALERHFDSMDISGSVELTAHPYVYRMRYQLPDPHPLVSVVIPSKDHADVLFTCVSSIIEKSTYGNFEIVVVENNSVLPETFERYRELEQLDVRIRVVLWQGKGFNYSALVNFGVSQAHGQYIVLLNNDTEVISPDWMEEMAGYLQRDDVGVVGAKLYYRDGLTQHAGVLIGRGDAVAHINQDFPRSRGGYLAKAVRPGNFSAVTGACQMMRREVFEDLGGYDEKLAVGFNDVDFCLRVWKRGLRVVFTPYAELYHDEFVSRGREAVGGAKLLRWKREQAFFISKWPEVFVWGDPFSNPAFDVNSGYYGLGE